MKIIKTQTLDTIVEYNGEYPANLDPTDVVEIFQTPLLVLITGIILFKIIVLKNYMN